MAAVTKFIAKNNKTTTSASRTTKYFANLMQINFTEGSVADISGGCSHY